VRLLDEAASVSTGVRLIVEISFGETLGQPRARYNALSVAVWKKHATQQNYSLSHNARGHAATPSVFDLQQSDRDRLNLEFSYSERF
jgi:hypothetical protein